MSSEYKCKICGVPLFRGDQCWKCRINQQRAEKLSWSSEEIAEKLENLRENIDALEHDMQPETDDFWALLCYHDAISPEIPRAAVEQGIYTPAEIYYHAPEDVRDRLIEQLMNTDDFRQASELMACLAMQGDDQALQTLFELEQNPRPWREKLYVNPSIYAQCAGWSFDANGQRQQLHFTTCYPMVEQSLENGNHAARIAKLREDSCPECHGKLVDMLVLDGRDPRLEYLQIHGIITATCCPNCVCFQTPAFSHFTLDGQSELFFDDPIGQGEENVLGEECENSFASNSFVLGEHEVPLFYGSMYDDVNTIGGLPNWVQDWEYHNCPICGKTMKYLAQIQWDTLLNYMEGTLYIEICPDCQMTAMFHQQT